MEPWPFLEYASHMMHGKKKKIENELSFLQRISSEKVLLGMVHLAPLPGNPAYGGESLDTITARACRDAQVLLDEGMDGCIVENFGDAPFFKERVPPHVLTVMTRIALSLPSRGAGRKKFLRGVNILRNDALGALAVAAAAELDFLRVNVHAGVMATDQGIIEGRAAETLRARALLNVPVAILADLLVKHAAPLGSGRDQGPAALARDLAERGRADGIIITGPATGAPCDLDLLQNVREALPQNPLLVGSGVTSKTISRLLEIADGAIIGSSLKMKGDVHAPVDPRRVRELVRSARGG